MTLTPHWDGLTIISAYQEHEMIREDKVNSAIDIVC